MSGGNGGFPPCCYSVEVWQSWKLQENLPKVNPIVCLRNIGVIISGWLFIWVLRGQFYLIEMPLQTHASSQYCIIDNTAGIAHYFETIVWFQEVIRKTQFAGKLQEVLDMVKDKTMYPPHRVREFEYAKCWDAVHWVLDDIEEEVCSLDFADSLPKPFVPPEVSSAILDAWLVQCEAESTFLPA